ncbi:MAG: DMT family transporter [Rhodospirillales bacterium]|nr:DMT family transporter [Rhodospirillales bacterium]
MSHPPKINMTMTPLEWGMLIALSLLWGGSFFFNGIAIKELPPLTIVLCRVGFAAILLYIFMRLTGRQMPTSGKVWQAFFGIGILQNVLPFSLILWGQTYIASGLASILNATTPLFAVIVAHFLTDDEKITKGRFLGVILGFTGITVLIGGDVFNDIGNNFYAQLACLGAALSYGFSGVYGRRFRAMGISTIATATGQVTASTLILIPIVLIFDQPWTLAMPSLAAIGAIAGLVIFATVLAYILFFRILGSAGATNIMLVTFLIPVSAILLGTFILNEVLELKHFVGMAIIGFGLAAIDGRPWKKLKGTLSKQA